MEDTVGNSNVGDFKTDTNKLPMVFDVPELVKCPEDFIPARLTVGVLSNEKIIKLYGDTGFVTAFSSGLSDLVFHTLRGVSERKLRGGSVLFTESYRGGMYSVIESGAEAIHGVIGGNAEERWAHVAEPFDPMNFLSCFRVYLGKSAIRVDLHQNIATSIQLLDMFSRPAQ